MEVAFVPGTPNASRLVRCLGPTIASSRRICRRFALANPRLMLGVMWSDFVAYFAEPPWPVQGLVVAALIWVLQRGRSWLADLGLWLHQRFFRPFSRQRRLKRLLWLRRAGRSQVDVFEQIVKTQVAKCIFMVSAVVFAFAFLTGPLFLASSGGTRYALLGLSLPVYVLEIIWLLNDHTLKVLKRRHDRHLRSNAT